MNSTSSRINRSRSFLRHPRSFFTSLASGGPDRARDAIELAVNAELDKQGPRAHLRIGTLRASLHLPPE